MVNDWKRALERAYSYQTFEQFYKALEQLPVCDFANEKTSLAKAIEFSKKFMTIMSKSEYLRLDYQQQEMVSQLLKQKGACKYDQAAEKFKPKKEENIHSMVTSSGNVYFPLSAMSQMIDTSNETFRIAMSKMNDGGKESWCMEWVNSQKPQEKSLEN
jgi:hypothetical protein